VIKRLAHQKNNKSKLTTSKAEAVKLNRKIQDAKNHTRSAVEEAKMLYKEARMAQKRAEGCTPTSHQAKEAVDATAEFEAALKEANKWRGTRDEMMKKVNRTSTGNASSV
jgi:hypothetical protein